MTTNCKLRKIISGGQTGADQGGLKAGLDLGLRVGGTAPKGYYTDDGPNLELKTKYGLEEGPDDPKIYPIRTRLNVKNSDGTLLVGNTSSPGTRLTIRLCEDYKKPHICNPTPEELLDWIVTNQIEILNVAGNRERKNPGIFETTFRLITQAMEGLV